MKSVVHREYRIVWSFNEVTHRSFKKDEFEAFESFCKDMIMLGNDKFFKIHKYRNGNLDEVAELTDWFDTPQK